MSDREVGKAGYEANIAVGNGWWACACWIADWGRVARWR